MATGSSAKPRTPGRHSNSGVVLDYDEFVDRQLSKVRSQIKTSDLTWSLMLLVTGTVGFLLLLALVDHWVCDLGLFGRLLALTALVIGGTLFVMRRLIPMVLHRINPAYAALVVERSEPSLKNSLLNLVFFRSQAHPLRKVVYQAVEQQAATGLTHVDIDTTVDRGPLVRMAAALAVIVTLAALYTVLSPKNSLQTVARVLAPWRDIPRPSRVLIRDVQPGTTQVFAGRGLEVSAVVENLGEQESAWLVYSTVDGQELDQRLTMQLTADDLRMHTRLPSASSGIYQDIDYHLRAGDAVAGPYRVKVLPAPSIVVDQITYDFPEYTGLVDETIPGHGDIVALEGTRVTIEASTNQEIRAAHLEFDPESRRRDAQRGTAPARRTLAMKTEGRVAQVSFTLQWSAERQAPEYASYWLKFTTANGGENDQPILHRIEVRRDIPPVVEILTPELRDISVPVDGRQRIEVRAVDPDFQLQSLGLVAEVAGQERWRKQLLSESVSGQVVKTFDFRPGELGFQAGETVIYRASGEDNRQDAMTDSAAPNVSRTDDYKMQITGPSGRQQSEPTPGEPAAGGAAENAPDDGDAAQDGERGAGGQRQESDGSGDMDSEGGTDESGGNPAGDAGQEGGEASGEGQSDSQSEGASSGAAGDASGTDGAAQSGEESGTGAESQAQGEDSQSSSDQGAASQSPDERGAAGDQQRGGDQPSDNGAGTAGEQSSAGEQSGSQPQDATGEQAREGQRSGDGDSSQDGQPSVGRRGQEADGEAQSGARPEDTNGPLPNDGSRDVDAFDRILDRMKERFGEEEDGAPRSPAGEQSDTPDDSQRASANESSEEDAQGEQNSGDPPEGQQDQQSTDGTRQSTTDEAAQGQPGESDELPPDTSSPDQTGQESQGRAAQSADERGAEEPSDGAKGQPQEPDAASDPESASPSADQSQPDGPPSSAERAQGDQPPPANEAPHGDPPSSEPPEPHAECTCNNTGQCSACQGQSESPGEASGEQDGSGEGSGSGSGSGAEAGGDPGSQGESAGTEPGSQDGQNGENSQDGERGQPGDSGGDSQQQGSSSAAGGSPGDQSQGGNAAGHDRASGGDSPGQEVEPGGDDPNLEYAKRATDLALEYLKDQQDNPDRELLEELGWDSKDVQEFVQRWQQLQREASRSGEDGQRSQRELDDALRGLGLYPNRDQIRKAGTRTSRAGGALESGARSRPPTEYLEAYKAYLRGTGEAEGE